MQPLPAQKFFDRLLLQPEAGLAGRCGLQQVMSTVHDLLAVCGRGLAQFLHPFLLDAKYELASGLL